MYSSETGSLLSADGAHGAGIGTSSAVDAHIRVDAVNISLGDGALRALRLAGAASYTDIRINFVCHCVVKLRLTIPIHQIRCRKCMRFNWIYQMIGKIFVITFAS